MEKRPYLPKLTEAEANEYAIGVGPAADLTPEQRQEWDAITRHNSEQMEIHMRPNREFRR